MGERTDLINMKVLINAYACCPNFGSEQGMAWNFITNIAEHCECYVITESEYKERILSVVESLPQRMNVHFYFVPIGKTEEESVKIRKMCWNQGTWAFYVYYSAWQKRILPVAEGIVEKIGITLMHQLNMVGFREPGMLYKINEKREKEEKAKIPLVWGPVAGYGSIPFSFMKDGGLKFTAFYLLKNFLNKIQLRWHPRVRKMMAASDVVIAATPEMRNGLIRCYNRDVVLMNETGTYWCPADRVSGSSILKSKDQKFRLLWVGRFIYTKQLELALRTLSRLYKYPDIELHVVGKGFDEFTTSLMYYKAQEAGVTDHVVWHGQIPNEEVQRLMRKCDVFFFTSIFEATSTVILEAITNNLPILCFDRCGFGPIVDGNIGKKIPCINPEQAVKDFANAIIYLNNHPEVLERMSRNCDEKKHELSWIVKIGRLTDIYNGLRG